MVFVAGFLAAATAMTLTRAESVIYPVTPAMMAAIDDMAAVEDPRADACNMIFEVVQEQMYLDRLAVGDDPHD